MDANITAGKNTNIFANRKNYITISMILEFNNIPFDQL